MYSTHNTYTNSGLSDEIKQQLATTNIDIQKYKEEIEKHRITRAQGQNWYDFDLDLDFSLEPIVLDNRKYYYRFRYYQPISLLKPLPYVKVSLQDLSLDSIKALLLLVPEEREYILKQVVGRIFEDIDSDRYHNSISSILKVKFIDGTNYDSMYTINQDKKDNNSNDNCFKEKQNLINQILREQERYFEGKDLQTNKNTEQNENSNSKSNNINNNYVDYNNHNYNDDNDRKNNNKDNKKKPKITTYKYSNKGKDKLYEAIILDGKPYFLGYNISDNSIEIKEQIEENSRILVPPDPEEYPYEPYEFENIDEIKRYIERANKEDHNSLFKKVCSIISKFNDQDNHKLNLVTIDVFHSYFQDRFSTVHYDLIVGGNGSGKSSFGDTFAAIAYRPVIMTDPTAPNLFRLLGKVEPGQCTIILEEAEKIDQSQELMNVLKTGYSYNGRVPRINTTTNKQEFFFSFGMKIIIAERAPNQTVAKGVMDRTYTIHCYKGIAKYDIKEVLNPTETGSIEHKDLLNELTNFRKIMLIYRLIHFKDPIPDVDIGIYGRDKELAKPSIQLFNGTQSSEIVIATLQKFLDLKNHRKESTIESALLPIIIDLICQYGNEFSFSTFWDALIENIPGNEDDKKPNEYHTKEYGTIYRTTITNTLRDIFGAKTKHRKEGNILIFDLEIVYRISKTYNNKIQIKSKTNSYNNGNDNDNGVYVDSVIGKQELNDSNNEENEDKNAKINTNIIDAELEDKEMKMVNRVNTYDNKDIPISEKNRSRNIESNLNCVNNTILQDEKCNNIPEKTIQNNNSFFVLPSLLSPYSSIYKIPTPKKSTYQKPIYPKRKIQNKNNESKKVSFDPRYLDNDLRSKIDEHLSSGKTLKCHNKNCQDKQYSSLCEYNKHCHSNHPKQLIHPDLSLIKQMGLEPRGNPWE